MKVKELIERLAICDPAAEVLLEQHRPPWQAGASVDCLVELPVFNPAATPRVFENVVVLFTDCGYDCEA